MIGTVVSFGYLSGYGFIRPDTGGDRDVFISGQTRGTNLKAINVKLLASEKRT